MSMLKNQKMFTWLRFCIAAYVFNKNHSHNTCTYLHSYGYQIGGTKYR